MQFRPGKAFAASICAVIIGGCASTGNQEAIKVERMLSASGFQMKLADTPEKLAHMGQMAERRLVPTNKDGEVVFVYADAKLCKCIYVGSQQNYQAYQRLAIEQNIVSQEHATATANEMTTANINDMNWGMWGTWPRPIIY